MDTRPRALLGLKLKRLSPSVTLSFVMRGRPSRLFAGLRRSHPAGYKILSLATFGSGSRALAHLALIQRLAA